ncbi:hypothetical protein F2Q69_00045915 [Brassica cretica]|uniref:Uncharacterized protein n=1 Tax=Brassica cretica TaxID=69181 RepID=A0A8S9PTV4_BRACR|nr:hypothetical protein F2Q69_00045915 [Brassica cretica]
MPETLRHRLLLKSPPSDQNDEDLRLLDVIMSLTSQSKRIISSDDSEPLINLSDLSENCNIFYPKNSQIHTPPETTEHLRTESFADDST